MKPPAKIKIGPHDYTVEAIPTTARDMADAEAAIEVGDLRITLGLWPAASKQRENLLHEVMHGLLYGAGFTHPGADGTNFEVSPDLDEALCKRVTPLLLEMLRANPQLVKFLTDPS